MTNQEIWRQRVEPWRASGLTSLQYCEGKPFTAGGLRHWAYRLEKQDGFEKRRVRVRMARVLRVAAPQPTSAPEAHRERQGGGTERDSVALTLTLGRICIAVKPGFEPATLSTLLDVLVAREEAGA